MTIIDIKHRRDLSRLRRLALSAQGLLQVKPFGVGLAGARKAINHLGYIQIDTLSVVERAHHHVLHSRVPKFQPTMIDKMLRDRDIFEYWTHAAAFLPIQDFRFSLPYKHAIKSGEDRWYKYPDQKLMAELLARIKSDGPLHSRNLENSKGKKSSWWDLKPAKKALEQLYMQGDLMISSRAGFQKAYDLTERVLPSDVKTQTPCIEEFAVHLIEQQLRCHGFVSLKGLTYLRRNAELRKAVKELVNERLAQQTLIQVRLNNGKTFLIAPGDLECPLPRLNNRMLILSPFDNSVIQRERLSTLFQFNYQIECYTPAAQRQYGYFCLPLLFRGEFVGRVDCKAHRKNRHLEIKSLHLEQNNFEDELVIDAFATAVTNFCHFQNCDTVTITSIYPKYLTQLVQCALKPLAQ